MGAVRRLWIYLTAGVLVCLVGFALFYLWRKLSLMSSSAFSETLESELSELKAWKRTAQAELESQFERIRSIAGRVDRAKRREPTSQDGSESTPDVPLDLDDQGKLNALLVKRIHGVG